MKRYGGDTYARKANIFVQFKLLLRRSLRENFRSKATLIIKTVQQVSLGLIYGTIYQLGMNQASVQDRFGLLSLIAIGASNMAMASTVRSFPKEKLIVSNELAAKMYGTLPYFIGKAISEVPMTAFFNSLFGVIVSVLTGLNGTWDKLKRFLGLNSLHGLTGQSAGLMIGRFSVVCSCFMLCASDAKRFYVNNFLPRCYCSEPRFRLGFVSSYYGAEHYF